MCLYIILSTTISFLDLTEAILFFTWSPYFHFVYISIFPRKYTFHVCYVFNVIRRILLMTDGLNAV